MDRLPIDRHRGSPMATLAEVRRKHNVVAAVSDPVAARRLILDLEDASVDPDAISLLGAWPAETERPPVVLAWRTLVGAGVGSMVGAAAGAITAVAVGASEVWLVALGVVTFGVAGAYSGTVAGTGSSPAWRRSLAADERGTVAVGVHSDEAAVVQQAVGVMERFEPMAVNEF